MDETEHHRRLLFESLVIEHHVRLRAFVRSLGVDPDWVDDVAQEAFLTAYRQWDTFDQARNFGKWLRGIAANIVRNEVRKNARRQRILHTELAELLLERYSQAPDRTRPLTVEAIRECLGAPNSHRPPLSAGRSAFSPPSTTREDVTCLCRFRSNDESVVEVDAEGNALALGRGDTHIVVFYDNGVAAVPVMRPFSATKSSVPSRQYTNPIDRYVEVKLSKLGISPARTCTDAEFLRRVSIDMTATLPAPDEIEEFLGDGSADKRLRKINELLDRPAYAAWWANKLCDYTGCSPTAFGEQTSLEVGHAYATQWYDWIYRRVAGNTPYDRLVEGIVLAESRAAAWASHNSRRSSAERSLAGRSCVSARATRRACGCFAVIGTPESSKRSAIFIFMEGGPSHQDTFDLKPQAPAEFRGEFNPISTSAGGVQICEHLPLLARRADKYAIIRGLAHNLADHGIGKRYLLTGNKPSQSVQYPEYGSVVSHAHPSVSDLASYVSIDEAFVGPGYLGSQYSPLTAEKPRHGFPYSVRGVTLEDGLTVAKYTSQKKLLDDLDTAFRGFEELDDQVGGLDRFSEQAYEIISSPRTRQAFDLSQEPASQSDRFGKHEFGQTLLLASRLIEAGVHFVTVRLRPAEFDFDTHSENFSKLRTLLPPFDRGLSALLDRLDERGLLASTAILATGEFGRTPKINGQGGRDHWARAMCALLAGGDVRGGQAIGESDATASEPAGRGFTPDDLAASFFRNIGIDPQTEFQTNVGRPITLVCDGTPIRRLF